MTVKKDVDHTIDTAADKVESTTRTAAAAAEHAADEATAKTVQLSRAGLETGKAAMAKAETGSRQMMDWAMQSYQANVAAFQAMLTSRSPQQILTIQSELMRDQLNLLLDAGSRTTAR
jgi:hypothetical protein